MPHYVAFLRAINVGGRRIASDDLAALFTDLGYDDVATYLASGNVVFRADEPPSTLAAQIEEAFSDQYDWEVPTFIRTVDEVAELANAEPFPNPDADTKHYIIFGKGELEAHRATLEQLSNEVDTLVARGREIHWLRDMAAGESMTTGEVEEALAVALTRRTRSTLARLINKYRAA